MTASFPKPTESGRDTQQEPRPPSLYPEGPYYVAADDALDCPPHANSGLALVDTGRSGDWPIARLCEWHTARRIALTMNCHEEMLAVLKAALAEAATRRYPGSFDPEWVGLAIRLVDQITANSSEDK